MEWDGDLPQLAVVTAGYKKYVEALSQKAIPSFTLIIRAGTPGQSEVAESLFGTPDFLGLRFHSWEWGISPRPFYSGTEDQVETHHPQSKPDAGLGSSSAY